MAKKILGVTSQKKKAKNGKTTEYFYVSLGDKIKCCGKGKKGYDIAKVARGKYEA